MPRFNANGGSLHPQQLAHRFSLPIVVIGIFRNQVIVGQICKYASRVNRKARRDAQTKEPDVEALFSLEER